MSHSGPATLRRTPLADLHGRQGARMVPFAGWEMPLQYSGIIEEHRAVRERAGVFDVSHMGRLFVAGADAAAAVRAADSFDVTKLDEGAGHYTLMCNDDGGIVDDPYVYRLDPERLLVVGNAANADRVRDGIERAAAGHDAELIDRQEQTVMLAVQGPQSAARMARIVGPELASLERRRCTELPYLQYKLFASRTGYTGEDGFELVTSVEAGRALWRQLLAEDVVPCGLGARDTLRLEAALPLWGKDIDETTTPYEAGLGWVVTLDDDAPFRGRDALVRARAARVARKLVCLKAAGAGVMRDGCRVSHEGEDVGVVTSGGYAPTLGTSVAMAYVRRAHAAEGTTLSVDVRGRDVPAEVVKRPFVRGTFAAA